MTINNPFQHAVSGEYYQAAAVPDTLDLSDRMALAVNALTRAWIPAEKWALGFFVDMSKRPAGLHVSQLTDAYLNIPPKFLAALVAARLGSGSDFNLDVDGQVIQAQMGLLGDDGLTYCPTDTMPDLDDPRAYAEIWGEGRMIHALTLLGQIDKDSKWLDAAKRKVDRILSLTTEKDGYRYLWRGRFQPGQTVPSDVHEPVGGLLDGSLLDSYDDPQMSIIYSVGSTGFGAGLLYRLTGYEPALELSKGLAKWALAKIFNDPDGRWNIYHFHHSLFALMAVCQYAIASNDQEVLAQVDRCFRWAREMGDPSIGYYTEWMPGSDLYLQWQQGNSVEICEVSDMIVLALYLTQAGVGDYWDDVDRWTRNMLAEGQMMNSDFLADLPDQYFDSAPSNHPYDESDDILERSVGSFFGWMRANDGIRVERTPSGPKMPNRSIMHCCTANGALAMYYVWDSIVTKQSDVVHINLLLNRASPWVDVDSCLPFQGQVVLHIKDAEQVSVRMPEWCPPDQVQVEGARTMELDGRHLKLRGLTKGDTVTLTFDVPESTVHRVIGDIPYKLTVRGSNVTSIDPKGVAYPLFEPVTTGESITKTQFIPKTGSLLW